MQNEKEKKKRADSTIEECQDKLRQAEREKEYALTHQKKVEIPVEKPVLYERCRNCDRRAYQQAKERYEHQRNGLEKKYKAKTVEFDTMIVVLWWYAIVTTIFAAIRSETFLGDFTAFVDTVWNGICQSGKWIVDVGVKIESILTTSDQAYSKTDLNSNTIEKEDGDVEGPFDLGVSITESLDDDKETQIVYYSTSNLMDSQTNQMVSGGNEKLIMESLKWMTDTEESASVSIPSKSLEVSYLTITDYDAAFWKICTIALIPGIFLVIGFVVWIKRRKA